MIVLLVLSIDTSVQGAGVCLPSVYDRAIEVLYGTNGCTNWTLVDSIR